MNWKLRKKYKTLLENERGYVKKNWGTSNTVCLAYPHYYRAGMSNLGFQTVYKIFNELPSFLCERVFLPAAGDNAEFAAGGAEFFSMESQKPVSGFDILAFSLSFENDYPNILKMLDWAGIPLVSRDRSECHPLILGGGIAVTINPEPVSSFFDLFILGEAEEVLPEFARLFSEARKAGLGRRDMLMQMQKKLPQIYVPGLYEVEYSADSRIGKIRAVAPDLPERIKINPAGDLDLFCTEETISAPQTEMEDMYLVEINRGCGRGCRFCAASFIYHPARFRRYENIVQSVDRGLKIKNKIGLIGTAVSDHPELSKICEYILKKAGKAGIGSLRVDRIDENMVRLLKAGGIETVALAPEAGSQRLRNLLRKGISEEDVLNAAGLLVEDIPNLRLYFMIGLPTEEEEDIDAIIDLAGKIQHRARQSTRGRKIFRSVTLSINQFIPKPSTPLQWCELADVGAAGRKIRKITNAFRREKQFKVIHDVPKWNYVQALLSLGDRRVGEILVAVHKLRGNWAQALKEVNVNADFYVYRRKQYDEILPWEIVDLGTSKKALVSECKKALEEN